MFEDEKELKWIYGHYTQASEITLNLHDLTPLVLASIATDLFNAIDTHATDQGSLTQYNHNSMKEGYQSITRYLQDSEGMDFISDHIPAPNW